MSLPSVLLHAVYIYAMLTKGVPLIRHMHVSTVCCYRLRERVSGTERKQNQGFGHWSTWSAVNTSHPQGRGAKINK